MPNTIYFVCTRCDDKFIMDEDYVEVPDSAAGAVQRKGLDYPGGDCRCPICETFSGRLVELGAAAHDKP